MNPKDYLPYIGNLTQLGGTRSYELTDGWARHMRAIDISTGAGLKYTILPDRGMDISLASYKDTNLVYIGCNGEMHPSYYEPVGLGWLRSFTAGLLTTCGLTHIGPPYEKAGESYGLHGRYSTIPAKQVADLSEWVGDDYHIRIKGTVEEGVQFGDKLRLTREISSVLGKNKLCIKDTVVNFGSKPSPYAILYHMNFGFPFLSEEAELCIDADKVEARDKEAQAGIENFHRFQKPEHGYKEQVFFHHMKKDSKGMASVVLQNKSLGLAVTLKFSQQTLPLLTQWKMMGTGEYVLGLEPCNVPCVSRDKLLDQNLLPSLLPGESVTNDLELEINEF